MKRRGTGGTILNKKMRRGLKKGSWKDHFGSRGKQSKFSMGIKNTWKGIRVEGMKGRCTERGAEGLRVNSGTKREPGGKREKWGTRTGPRATNPLGVEVGRTTKMECSS